MKRLIAMFSMAALAGCQVVLAQAPPPIGSGLAITDVTVIDMTGAPPRPHMTVVVENDRVVRMAPATDVKLGPGVATVSGAGRYLIPGLWDMHSHVTRPASQDAVKVSLPLYLSWGVVGVRDMGARLDELQQVRAAMMPEAPLPDLVAAGPLLDGPKGARFYVPDVSLALPDVEAARKAVADLAAAKVNFLKVYDLLTPEQHAAIVEEAMKHGLRVVGHIPGSMSLEQVVAGGQTGVEHISLQMIAGCTPDGDKAFPTMLQVWRTSGDEGKLREFDAWFGKRNPAACLDLYRRIAARGLHVTPTLSFDLIGTPWTQPDSLADQPAAAKKTCDTRLAGLDTAPVAIRDAEYRDILEIVRQLHAAGVPLLAGTDATNACIAQGRGLHEELRLLHMAGLSNYETLQTATRNAARFLGRTDEGVVREGARASLLLLEADPLADIENTRRIAGVLNHGRWRDAKELANIRSAALAAAPK